MKPTTFVVSGDEKQKPIQCERYTAPGRARGQLIFTHGSGGGLDAPAMVDFSEGFATNSPIVNFKGSMNLKGRVNAFTRVIEHEISKLKGKAKKDMALGGRSMGARAAIMARSESVKQLVLVSYPLTNAKGETRDQILLDLPDDVDVLFISGSRDNMCDLELLRNVMNQMSATTWLVEVEGADHGMNTRKGAKELRRRTGIIAAEWLDDHDESKRARVISNARPSDKTNGEEVNDTDWEA